MELIESGFTIILLILLLSIFIFSFTDRNFKSYNRNNKNLKKPTKISTQDGMVSKKGAKGPLLLVGDSKSIR